MPEEEYNTIQDTTSKFNSSLQQLLVITNYLNNAGQYALQRDYESYLRYLQEAFYRLEGVLLYKKKVEVVKKIKELFNEAQILIDRLKTLENTINKRVRTITTTVKTKRILELLREIQTKIIFELQAEGMYFQQKEVEDFSMIS